MTGPLAGRTALVTGGSRGIGAASATALAELGAHVVLTYQRDRAAAGQVAKQCRAAAGSADVVQADLDGVTGADLLLAELPAEVDIVVANATTAHPRLGVLRLTTEQLLTKVDADLAVTHRLAQALVPGMQKRGFGRIVVISSGHAIGPSAPAMAAYGVGKAALEALVRYVAAEEGHSGVTVNAVRPSFVRTDTSRDVPEPVRAAMVRSIPAGRLAEAEDVAGVVALIAQPSAGWVNGVSIPATGGLNHPIDWSKVLQPDETRP